ncbi:MAG: hypothetical protein LBO07_05905 [Coriobacteriales bacterium]|nr:hypothetical protein [Coriobacteriales bacterium]
MSSARNTGNRHEYEARYAAEMARRILGVDAEVWDTASRQGAPDVKLIFQDGRIGMLEVTKYDERFELMEALKRDHWELEEYGRWVWTLAVDNFSDYQFLRENYKHIIDTCEAHGATKPDSVPFAIQHIDPVFRRLVTSKSNIYAAPDLGKLDQKGNLRKTHVLPTARCGFSSDGWEDLHDALVSMFADQAISHRCRKLINTAADFRCLMVACGLNKLPFSIADKLNFSKSAPVPSTEPPLPTGIDALILVPQYSGSVLLWNDGLWTIHLPWD